MNDFEINDPGTHKKITTAQIRRTWLAMVHRKMNKPKKYTRPFILHPKNFVWWVYKYVYLYQAEDNLNDFLLRFNNSAIFDNIFFFYYYYCRVPIYRTFKGTKDKYDISTCSLYRDYDRLRVKIKNTLYRKFLFIFIFL